MDTTVNRLIVVIVHSDDADQVNQALVEAGYGATRINAQGGFLRRGNAVFMIGIASDQVDDAINRIRAVCSQPAAESPDRSTYGILFVLRLDGHTQL